MKTAPRRGRWRAAAAPHAAIAALLLAACATAPPRGETGIDGIACAAPDGTLPAALQWLPDAAVPRAAEGASGRGGICRGRVYAVREPMPVHRLWDEARRNDHGHWWTLHAPSGSRDDYRHAYAVCSEWNALDHAITCTLQPGARVVVGSGQSADCTAVNYAKSPLLQVYVPADAPDGALPLLECRVRPYP
ncbi:MAG: hypothetical protein ABIX46_13870 [Burkholderiaceae bacterium]